MMRAAVLVMVIALTCACRREHPLALTHEAYVWQRVWTPAVDAAMRESAGRVAGWRILAAERNARGGFERARFRLDGLREPVTLVVRISGSRPAGDAAEVARLLGEWNPQAVEIDHDCATARLPEYAAFLRALRSRVAGRLSITALPAWLANPQALGDVLAVADESVLQVHAVMDPRRGLFADAQALEWAKRWAEFGRPFRVAVPSYGSRVVWTAGGAVAAIESESLRLGSDAGEESQELFATPQAVHGFLTRLRELRLPGLRGVVWFRLPVEGDARAWSLRSWHAVMEGRIPEARVVVETRATATAGTLDAFAVNAGEIDAELPGVMRVEGACRSGGGVSGFVFEAGTFRAAKPRLLRVGERTLMGWLRCGGR